MHHFLKTSSSCVNHMVIAFMSAPMATVSYTSKCSLARAPLFDSLLTHLPCFFAAVTILSRAAMNSGSSPRAGT